MFFRISICDAELIESLKGLLECGVYNQSVDRNLAYIKVCVFEDIYNKIIPFFLKYPLQRAKALDLADFCKAADLIKNKAHLTKEGMDQILKIKTGMNTGRKYIK
jgi:LAGLIDADG endonuclease